MGKYLVAASVAALSIAGAASAQPATGQFYGKAFGGWTIPQNDDFDLDAGGGATAGSGLDYDTGYVLGLAGGYQFSPNVAFELEYAYRNADANLKDMDTSGALTSNAFMANAIYSFPGIGTNGAFRPYVGAGLGLADAKYDPDDLSSFEADYNFAYQVITGVAYDINPQWTLNGEVRFFGINDQDFESDDLKFKSPFHTFDALIGATYHF
jgi:opacity protein-like surface antigen